MEQINLTNTFVGLAAIQRCMAGEDILFTKLEIGDGILTNNDVSGMTGLINKTSEFPLGAIQTEDNEVIRLRSNISNKDINTDLVIREYGIYAKFGEEQEFLFAYLNVGESTTPLPNERIGRYELNRDFVLYIGNSLHVDFTSNGHLVYVAVNEYKDDMNRKANVVGTIEDLKNSKKYKVGDVVEVLGYYTPADGGGHTRQKAPDGYIGEDAVIGIDGSIWKLIHFGKIKVSWFGVNKNESNDNTALLCKIFSLGADIDFDRKMMISNLTTCYEGTIYNLKIEEYSQNSDFCIKFINSNKISIFGGSLKGLDTFESWSNLTLVEKQKFNQMIKFENCSNVQVENIFSTGKIGVVRAESCHNIIFKNIIDSGFLTGQQDVSTGANYYTSVSLFACTDAKIIRINSNKIGSSVLIGGDSINVVVRDCNIFEASDNAIYNSSGKGITIVNNFIRNSNNGIKSRGVDLITSKNYILNSKSGISVTGNGTEVDSEGSNGNSIIVSENIVDTTDIYSIYINVQDGFKARGIDIINNKFKKNKGGNIACIVSAKKGVKIKGNTFEEMLNNKTISCVGTQNENFEFLEITDNTFDRCSDILQLTYCSNSKINSNIFKHCSKIGEFRFLTSSFVDTNLSNNDALLVMSSTYLSENNIIKNNKIKFSIPSTVVNKNICSGNIPYIQYSILEKIPMQSLFFMNTGKPFVSTESGVLEIATINLIIQLDTPYMTTKMRQEGVYEYFIDYMDRKTEYGRLQRELEQQRQLAFEERENQEQTYEEWLAEQPMMLPVEEEPQPDEKLLEFANNYRN